MLCQIPLPFGATASIEWWHVAAFANGVVGIVYLAIAVAILRPLLQSGQVRANRLGLATAAIFVTCAVHHGGHAVHLVLPSFGLDMTGGVALRAAFTWHQALWDVATAGVGVYYWSLRRSYGPLLRGAQLFDDVRERQRRALEINDNVVQSLTVAHLALSLDEKEQSREAIEASLASARQIITDLLGDARDERLAMHPGDFVRSGPAGIGRP